MSQVLRATYPLPDDSVADSIFARLQRALRHYAPRSVDAHPSFQAAMKDVLSHPGGLARAALVLRTGQENGLSQTASEQLACALEYWHIASLLFDDLPCMDDADERRGRPPLHRVYGEANAILVALALINRGYVLVADAFVDQPQATVRDAISTVEAAVGPSGLIGGQSRDLNYTPHCRPREIARIAWQKTGMLFWLSLALPSLPGDLSEAEKRDLRALSVYWGIVYQGLDDLSDFHSGGSDINLERPNLVRHLGERKTALHVSRLLALAAFRLERLVMISDRWDYLSRWHQQVLLPRAGRVIAL